MHRKLYTRGRSRFFLSEPLRDKFCPELDTFCPTIRGDMQNRNPKIKNAMKKSPTLKSPPCLLTPVILAGLAITTCGCQVLTYRTPAGERLTRSSLGANTSISSLTLEGTTNGIRRVELHGYKNDTSQALGTVTEAAVKAAIGAIKP
jgi:hypothetical protein